MSTPNPKYDPNWRTKWHAARLRLEATADDDSMREMWAYLDLQYPTLEAYHAELVRRLENLVPDKPVNELLPFDPSGGPDAMQQRATALWHSLAQQQKREELVMDVRGRKWHGQPQELQAFADSVEAECEREVVRIRWGGLHGNPGSSETIAISELSEKDAHICFLSPATRGTHPSVDDTQGTVILPSTYYREILAKRYSPDQVTWYHYVSGGGFAGDVWFFRRASLQWRSTGRRFLWIELDPTLGHFMRSQSSNEDYHFRSVPSLIGEAVLHADDPALPIVELPVQHF